jgi:AraC-like DNA-binding protein
MSTDSHLQVSAGLTFAIVESLRLQGLDNLEALLQEAGIERALLQRPENRIGFESQQALWRLAAKHSPQQPFALQFARSVQPASFGMVGYLVMNCRSIDQCLDAIVQYQFLAGQGGEFRREANGAQTRLGYVPLNPGDPVTGERVAGLLAATVTLGRWLAGGVFRPRQVVLATGCQPWAEHYEEFFACPVNYAADVPYLEFCRDVLQLPVPNASEELLLLLRERADRLLDDLPAGGGTSARVTSLLGTQLSDRVPDRVTIAAQLGMSERSLQRRLQQEGTSFQALLDRTRHYLARELLRNTSLPLGDVAVRLGFAEPSAFYRAFRKWEGCTPGQYRG